MIACASPNEPENEPVATTELAEVVVRGTVNDYRHRAVADASVNGRSLGTRTDRQGRFTLRVPPRTRLTATKHDLLGSVEIGSGPNQDVVIVMAQMPM